MMNTKTSWVDWMKYAEPENKLLKKAKFSPTVSNT